MVELTEVVLSVIAEQKYFTLVTYDYVIGIKLTVHHFVLVSSNKLVGNVDEHAHHKPFINMLVFLQLIQLKSQARYVQLFCRYIDVWICFELFVVERKEAADLSSC